MCTPFALILQRPWAAAVFREADQMEEPWRQTCALSEKITSSMPMPDEGRQLALFADTQ